MQKETPIPMKVPVYNVPVLITVTVCGTRVPVNTFINIDELDGKKALAKARKAIQGITATAEASTAKRVGTRYRVTGNPPLRFGGERYDKDSILAVAVYGTTVRIDCRRGDREDRDTFALWCGSEARCAEAFRGLLQQLGIEP